MSELQPVEWKESWGVAHKCKSAGLPVPSYQYDLSGFVVELKGKILGATTHETTQETTQEKILALIKKNPSMTRKAMAESIGITADGVKYHLQKLKVAGVIKHKGSTKAGYWEILGDEE